MIVGKKMSKDYYQRLEISKKANQEEIKQSYRKLAKQYHPDANSNDDNAVEQFKQITEAYEILKDPQKRATYDQFGSTKRSSFRPGSAGSDGVFDHMMSGFFRSQFHQNPNEHIGVEVLISLEEAAVGLSKTIPIPREIDCTKCYGSGQESGTGVTVCSFCNGLGMTQVQSGVVTIQRACRVCGGLGKTIDQPCSLCGGLTKILKRENIEISIPAGVKSGSKLRIQGKGQNDDPNFAPGDLIVVIKIPDHPVFERSGNNLRRQAEISCIDAMLGTTIDITTIYNKKVKLTVPAGTQSMSVLRLNGLGIPVLNTNRKGDMFVQIQIDIPHELTAKQKELLVQFKTELKKT